MTEDFLDAASIADIVRTLYGVDTATHPSPKDRPDVFFGHHFDVTAGFVQDGNLDQMYRLDLELQLGKIIATPDEWNALLARLAGRLNKLTGENWRAASWKEQMAFQARQEEKALGEYFMKTGTTGDA